MSCGLTGSLHWLAGSISSLITSVVLARSCVASISEQCSVLVPSMDRMMSPMCRAPHLKAKQREREKEREWRILKSEWGKCKGKRLRLVLPFHHTGWPNLIYNNDLFAPVHCCGKADPQAGRETSYYLHQQRAWGLLHSFWNRWRTKIRGMLAQLSEWVVDSFIRINHGNAHRGDEQLTEITFIFYLYFPHHSLSDVTSKSWTPLMCANCP